MCFQDILHCSQESKVQIETEEAPAFFSDLNLDQIVHAVTMGKESFNLKPYFHTPLGDIQTIQYRQEIAQDFENEALMDVLKAFANEMIIVRRYLGLVDKLSYRYHRESWFLEAALVYSNAVTSLLKGMSEVDIRSNGLQAFRTYLTEYAGTPGFVSLMNEATHIKHELSKVQYNVLIKGLRVTVSRPTETESDYSREVEDTFRHLQQVTTVKHKPLLVTGSGMSPVEAQILEFVARLYPDVFAALLSYYARNHDFVDETISIFDRQAQFYIAYLDYIARYKRMGLPFCYPSMSAEDKEVYADEAFDLALARKLSPEHVPVVCNDFHLQNKERIMVVSGPNQGGKTTFARTFGQLHYLASLGLPVPGKRAKLFLFDHLFTHFEQEEDIKNLRGKLQDDLIRIHSILEQATPNSIIIMNEIFTSTTLKDAIFLGEKILGKINDLDILCVMVTFVDELAYFSEKTVSMVSTVNPENPSERTFKIVRKPADGLAFALSIAEKYRVTYARLKERIKP